MNAHTVKRFSGWLGIISLSLLIACSGDVPEHVNTPPKKAPETTVTFAHVQEKLLTERVNVLAEIEALERPTVVAETSGRILRLHATIGQRVQAGDLLAEIDDGNLNNDHHAKTADTARIKAQRDNKARDLARFTELQKQGFVTQTYLDNMKAELIALDQQLNAAQAHASNAARELGKASVRAPISGKIDERNANLGEFVSSGKPLFVISGEQGLRARFSVSERDADHLKLGTTLYLKSSAGETFALRVTELRPELNPQNRMREAFAPLPVIHPFHAGQPVEGELILREQSQLAVPSNAIVQREVGAVVFVEKNGKVQLKQVETGISDQGLTAIENGLTVGERVVVEGAGFLSDGEHVRDSNAPKRPKKPE